jgi:hypothetical protein
VESQATSISAATGGLRIYAMGPPCDPKTVWHGCLPAFTVAPTFIVAGVFGARIKQAEGALSTS